MNYLLDTHVVIWWFANDPNLSAKAREIIADASNIIYVSSASAWEIVFKKALGKLRAPDNFVSLTTRARSPSRACGDWAEGPGGGRHHTAGRCPLTRNGRP